MTLMPCAARCGKPRIPQKAPPPGSQSLPGGVFFWGDYYLVGTTDVP